MTAVRRFPLVFRAPQATRPSHLRLRAWLALTLSCGMLSVAPMGGRAADPQPYEVTIAPTGNAALDQALHNSATLITLHDSAPAGPFALVGRARGDIARFTAALHSYGYYDGTVAIRIAGHALDDPGLVTALSGLPAQPPAKVEVTATPGPLYHLRHITLTGDVPDEARAELGLSEGAPAVASDVLAAQGRLLAALRDSGHALAKVDPPVASLAPDAKALDVSFAVQAGPRVDIGTITFAGLKRMNERFVRRRLLLHPGDQFNPGKIEAARADLGSLGVFSAVRMEPAAQTDPAGALPVRVDVTERDLRTVSLGAAYSTDLGGSLSASWTHHNLFGDAESLTLGAAATQLGGTASRQPGYNLSALLTLPDWGHRDQSLSFNAAAIKEFLQAYDRTAYQIGTTLSRRITPEITVSTGLQAEQAHFIQNGASFDYTLLQAPLSVQYDNTHAPLDPTHGLRASLTLTPSESLGHRSSSFVIAQASGSIYFDFGSAGRSVLALRGLVGGVEGAATYDIPPDQRFYAGGGGTVRGFRYQSIGPHFPSGVPVGGTSVDVGSVEFRQRFGASYGAVAFVDAGQVASGGVPFEGRTEIGAGIGARYYTSFGPIRIDVAVPLTKETQNDKFELYLGIGQAF